MANCGQYYHCVTKQNFTGLNNIIALGILSGALTIVAIVVAVIAGAAIPGLGVIAGVAFVVAVFELCDYLHGGKLICLGDNSCAIGRIMELIPVGSDKSGFEKMDDDFTFNILLSPHAPSETKNEQIVSDQYQGKFIEEQSESRDLGQPYIGVSVTIKDIYDALGVTTEVFHCEVKGCRVHDVCAVLKVMSFGAPVVAAICSIPIVGWIACLIAAAIWLAITATAVAIAWNATHNGDINDVYDPAAGKLVPADPDTGDGGDVVLVRGDWAYDEGHDGWNEMHPVRSVQKLTDVIDPKFRAMSKADAALVNEFKEEVLDPWCFYTGQADDPDIKGHQDDPENDWDIHPDIDGCERDGEPEPIK
jgi:hypothetical protein